MARAIKTMGLDELKSLKKRVIRQRALGRITAQTEAVLVTKIDDLEVIITNMQEDDPELNPLGDRSFNV